MDRIKFEVSKKKCYGEEVYSNLYADELRKTQCLCLNCGLLTCNPKTNCKIANKLYKISKEQNMAMMITRCKKFVLKNTN